MKNQKSYTVQAFNIDGELANFETIITGEPVATELEGVPVDGLQSRYEKAVQYWATCPDYLADINFKSCKPPALIDSNGINIPGTKLTIPGTEVI